MKNNFKSYALILFFVFLLLFTQTGLAAEEADITEVNISHRIERMFSPEKANINVEAWSMKKDLEEAYTDATNRMNNVIQVLKTFENVTYTTSTFSVNQRYVNEGEDKRNELYYEVSTLIKVETDNLDQLGNIIERVVSMGATNIRGISYGLKYPEKAKNKVIKDGIKEIEEKALIIQESLGKESYNIAQLDINDNYNFFNYSYTTRSDMSAQESLPVPEIAPEDVRINVSFSVKLEYK